MASLVPPGPGCVVEVGPGTGAITEGLIRAGLGDQVWALEKDPVLAQVFHRAHPTIALVVGDATALAHMVTQEHMGPVKAVVSSLGLLNMPAPTVAAIAGAIAAVLPAGAPWIQYSYGRKSPLPRRLREAQGWQAVSHGTVWANLPPAQVWTFVRS